MKKLKLFVIDKNILRKNLESKNCENCSFCIYKKCSCLRTIKNRKKDKTFYLVLLRIFKTK